MTIDALTSLAQAERQRADLMALVDTLTAEVADIESQLDRFNNGLTEVERAPDWHIRARRALKGKRRECQRAQMLLSDINRRIRSIKHAATVGQSLAHRTKGQWFLAVAHEMLPKETIERIWVEAERRMVEAERRMVEAARQPDFGGAGAGQPISAAPEARVPSEASA